MRAVCARLTLGVALTVLVLSALVWISPADAGCASPCYQPTCSSRGWPSCAGGDGYYSGNCGDDYPSCICPGYLNVSWVCVDGQVTNLQYYHYFCPGTQCGGRP
jgi:hypothetical protein